MGGRWETISITFKLDDKPKRENMYLPPNHTQQ